MCLNVCTSRLQPRATVTPEQRNYHGYRVLSTVLLPQTPAFCIKGQAPPAKMSLK